MSKPHAPTVAAFGIWCWLVDHIWFPCKEHNQLECLRCGKTISPDCYSKWG